MSDESEQLKKRTMQFALGVCGLLKRLPTDEPGPTVRRQLAKASTGIAFNTVRHVGRGRMRNTRHVLASWRRRPTRHRDGWNLLVTRTWFQPEIW